MTKRIVAVVLGVLLTTSGCSSLPKLQPRPAPGADLTGTWQLDREASDNPEEALQAARDIARIEGAGRPHGSGDGAGRRGRGGFSRRGGNPDQSSGSTQSNRSDSQDGDQKETRETSTPIGGPLALDEQLAIRQDGNVVDLHAGRSGHTHYEPGIPITQFTGRGDSQISNGWQDASFVVVTQDKRGDTRIDRFMRLADGVSLEVRTTLTSKRLREPVTIRRLYRMAPVA